MIDYVVRKYGKDRVVQIVTFGTLAARGVDSRCGACDGYAVCFCRFDCEDDTAGAEDDD